MRFLATTLEIARQTLVLQARSRMTLLLLAVAILFGAGFMFFPTREAREHPGDELYCLVGYFAFCQFAMPFAALWYGVVAIHADIEDRTATYLFLRPVSRASLALGKWLGAILLALALTWSATLLLFLGFSVPRREWLYGVAPSLRACGVLLSGAALAVPGYVAVGAFCGAFFRRPLITAIVFLVGWEVVVSNLPPQAGVRGATIADPLRRWLARELPPSPELLDALTANLGPLDADKLTDPITALVRFTVLALGLALFVYSRREYDSRPRD